MAIILSERIYIDIAFFRLIYVILGSGGRLCGGRKKGPPKKKLRTCVLKGNNGLT